VHVDVQVAHGGRTSCTIQWPEGGPISSEKAFVSYAFTLAFAVPVALISVFYYLVVAQLRAVGPSTTARRSSTRRRESSRRVTRMVLAVISLYVVCWLPYWVFQVSRDCRSLPVLNFVSTTCSVCRKHDVRPSVRSYVCLSVTLVHCDHIVQQRVKMGTWQDRTVYRLPARRRRPAS